MRPRGEDLRGPHAHPVGLVVSLDPWVNARHIEMPSGEEPMEIGPEEPEEMEVDEGPMAIVVPAPPPPPIPFIRIQLHGEPRDLVLSIILSILLMSLFTAANLGPLRVNAQEISSECKFNPNMELMLDMTDEEIADYLHMLMVQGGCIKIKLTTDLVVYGSEQKPTVDGKILNVESTEAAENYIDVSKLIIEQYEADLKDRIKDSPLVETLTEEELDLLVEQSLNQEAQETLSDEFLDGNSSDYSNCSDNTTIFTNLFLEVERLHNVTNVYVGDDTLFVSIVTLVMCLYTPLRPYASLVLVILIYDRDSLRNYHVVVKMAYYAIVIFNALPRIRYTYKWRVKLSAIQMSLQHKLRTLRFTKPSDNPSQLRQVFKDTIMPKIRPVLDHTHGESAAERSAASLFIDVFARKLGKIAYFYQMSTADLRKGRVGCRTWYWSKDVTTPEIPYDPPNNSIIAMVDVDQYVDMNDFLAFIDKPVILYTFQPYQVSRVGKDYCYTFENNKVKYTTGGGGYYEHEVWNYSKDSLIVTTKWCDIPYFTNTFLVERRQLSPDRELILLVPTGSWYVDVFGLNTISGNPLRRIKMRQDNGFNRLRVAFKDKLYMSTGFEGGYASATIPMQMDDAIRTVCTKKHTALTMANVKLIIKDDDEIAASALYGYYSSLPEHEVVPVFCPVEMAAKNYTFKPKPFAVNKPAMVEFMQPLVDGAFIPTKTKSNEEECILQRIEKVRAKQNPVDEFVYTCMQEFVDLLIPKQKRNTLVLADYDEVWERQGKPTQRKIVYESFFKGAKKVIKAFMKTETYQDVKPPRNISTLDGRTKVEYSRVIYSFEKFMKCQSWYAFSKKPCEIANRVATVCRNAQYVVNSDFSKFDGRLSLVLRNLEGMILMTAFRKELATVVGELHRSQYNVRGFGSFFTKYDTGTSRASGSPETSIFNSLDNAFISYLTWRRTQRNGVYYTPLEAWNKLGIYGGDDGLTADIDTDIYVKTAEMLGQVLTSERVERGKLGVSFLARKYGPGIWLGDPTSTCDIKRQISKFHVTPKLDGVTPVEKLAEKARSFMLTDHDTPIIGDLCRKVKEFIPLTRNERLAAIMHWNGEYELDVQYPNDYADWMADLVERDLPSFDMKLLHQALSNAKSVHDLLKLPMCNPPVLPDIKTRVQINDDIHPIVLDRKHTKSIPETKLESKYDNNGKPQGLEPAVNSGGLPKLIIGTRVEFKEEDFWDDVFEDYGPAMPIGMVWRRK